MSEVTIRPIKKEDEKPWRELFSAYHQYYEIEEDEEVVFTTFSRFFNDKEPVFCSVAALDDGKLIGFVTWVYHRSTLAINNYLYLHDLYVDPSIRSKGVGRKLIEHVYQDADKNQAARVYWQTKVR